MQNQEKKKVGPDFLCIGLPKAGTSWLYDVISLHPDVKMTTYKEINYLGRKIYFKEADTLKNFYKSNHYIQKQKRSYFSQRIKYYRNAPLKIFSRWRDFIWDIRFLFGRRTDRWYLSLFDKDPKYTTGDISPVYYLLPDDEVATIQKFLKKEIKIIIILRDPIDRVWSHTKMRITRGKGWTVDSATDKYIRSSFDVEYRNCPNYVALISRWKKHFGDINVHVAFYDRLQENPNAFFIEICDFLGLSKERFPENLSKRLFSESNIGDKTGIPDEYAHILGTTYQPMLAELIKEFPDLPYIDSWMQKCDAALNAEAR